MKKSFSWTLVFAGLFLALPALATNFKTEIDQRLSELLSLPGAEGPSPKRPACLKRYSNLYKDGTLNVAIGFGYWDNSPEEYVFDSFIANGLRLALAAPCRPGMNVCGFAKAGDYYSKTITGPDGKKNKMVVSITYGSLSSDNVANTTKNKAAQEAHCQKANEKFFGEVSRGSEIVMYIGHSRNGGGPDFCPPVRDAHKHTNYDWYRAQRPGITKLLSSMDTARAAGRPTQIVGMYSCSSKLHFYNRLYSRNPGTGLILTTEEIYSAPAITSIVSTLDSIMEMKCSKGMNESLDFARIVKTFGMFPN